MSHIHRGIQGLKLISRIDLACRLQLLIGVSAVAGIRNWNRRKGCRRLIRAAHHRKHQKCGARRSQNDIFHTTILVQTLQSANPEWLQESAKSRTIVRPLFASGFAFVPPLGPIASRANALKGKYGWK